MCKCKLLNFKKSRLRYQPTDIETLQAYFCEIFFDLSNSKHNSSIVVSTGKEKTIDKDVFVRHIGLPFMIGERIFTHLAKGKNKLKLKDFVEGLMKLYNGDLSQSREIIFGILDFNNDGFIVAQDVGLFLSFLYFKKEGQAKTLNKIDRLIENFFKDVEYMSFDIFINLVDNTNSGVFILLTTFLSEHKFFDERALEIYNLDNDRVDSVLTDYGGQLFKNKFENKTNFKNFLSEEILKENEMEEEN
jgi:hypothetical protein